MKKSIFFVIAILGLLSISCSSVPKGKANFTGIVVDENNKPIQNYFITCKSLNQPQKVCATNEGGVFVFEDVDFGKLELGGFKMGYALYSNPEYNFTNPETVLCIQIDSSDVVYEKARNLLVSGQLEEADKLYDMLKESQNLYLKQTMTGFGF
ncbi:MAG: hypothetical protein MJ188_07300 [Treponema sp.]|nr:hypothetical protein [Treponema sp.]